MPSTHSVSFITPSLQRRSRHWVALMTFALGMVAGASAMAEPESLLSGKRPMASRGVGNPARLTDGLLSNEGDEWLTDVTSRFTSSTSYVDYDLGGEKTFRCL